MEKVSFIESVIKIIKTISSVPLLIEMSILTIIMILVISIFSIIKSKKWRTTCLIIYCVSLIMLPISHLSFFVSTTDKIIGNFVEVIYFPSVYVYIAILLFTDVDVMLSLIKNIKKSNFKLFNFLNIIYVAIIQLLFFAATKLIIEKNIDVFNRAELYSDSQVVSFIQICSYLFWIRILIKIVIRIINVLNNYSFKKKDKKEIKTDTYIELKPGESKTSVNENVSNQEEIKTELNSIKTDSGMELKPTDSKTSVNEIISKPEENKTESKDINLDLDKNSEDKFFDDFYE